jgi:hypothetical protein
MLSRQHLRFKRSQYNKSKKKKNKKRAKTITATTETSRPASMNKKELYNSIVSKNVSINSSEIDIPDNLKHEILKTIQRQQIRKKMKEDNLNRLKMQIA